MVFNRFLNRTIIISLLVILSLVPIFSQDTGGDPSAILVYADDDYEIEVIDADGVAMDAYIGMDLLEGDTIKTYNSTAELQLEPNGSIIKLSESTNFRVDGFQRDNNSSNDFSLVAGKLRAVAARSSTVNYNYNIYTQSTVCGVRGTDFLIGDNGKLVVGDGKVEFIKIDTGESVMVDTGMIADAFADAFEAIALTADQLAQEFAGFDFEQLDPFAVEGHNPPTEPESDDEGEGEEDDQEDEGDDDEGVVLENVDTGTGDDDDGTAADTGDAGEDSMLNTILDPIKDFLGMEIGSMTIDGETWSKVVLQPEFSIGQLQMSLYIPIIYETDVFDPNDWYRPAGNDEWSFGTDQEDVDDIIADFSSDLFLKIKYVKWGEQRDPFYFKLGNVDDMTLGHGILMDNYANDAEFPVVRKVGLNMGINREKMGMEFVGDDLSNPQILGGRMAFGSKLKFGISGITDLNPEENTPDYYLDEDDNIIDIDYEDPQFINMAVDLDFSLFETDLLSFVFFTDAATMLPIINGQIQTNFIYDSQIDGDISDQLRNYGFAGGLLGNILGAQYKIQYQYGVDLFAHGLYNSTYDVDKAYYLDEVYNYLNDKEADNGSTFYNADYAYFTPVVSQGIYGALTWELAGILDITGGYKWPWDEDGMDFEKDYFHIEIVLKPDVIPVVGIHGSLAYDRTNFVGAMVDADKSFQFIDENTVFKGELIYPIAETLDIGVILTSALERDSDTGKVIYDEDGKANAYYAFTINTMVSF